MVAPAVSLRPLLLSACFLRSGGRREGPASAGACFKLCLRASRSSLQQRGSLRSRSIAACASGTSVLLSLESSLCSSCALALEDRVCGWLELVNTRRLLRLEVVRAGLSSPQRCSSSSCALEKARGTCKNVTLSKRR